MNEQKPNQGCTCQDCGQLFKVDLNIPDELWEKIREGNNLLCGRCIMEKIEDLGECDYWYLTKGHWMDAAVNHGYQDCNDKWVKAMEEVYNHYRGIDHTEHVIEFKHEVQRQVLDGE